MPHRATPELDQAVDVCVVCTSSLETAPLARRLGGRRKTIAPEFVVYRGVLARRPVVIAELGPARRRWPQAVDSLLFVHRPKWLISAGFAVGLSEPVREGDTVLASELVNVDGHLLTVGLSSVGQKLPTAKHTGRIVSLAKLPQTAPAKRDLAQRSGALAADTSSFLLARLCSQNRTEFLAMRVVLDDASANATPGSLAVLHPSRSFRIGGVVGAFLSGSGHVARMKQFRRQAQGIAGKLADFLADLVARLN